MAGAGDLARHPPRGRRRGADDPGAGGSHRRGRRTRRGGDGPPGPAHRRPLPATPGAPPPWLCLPRPWLCACRDRTALSRGGGAGRRPRGDGHRPASSEGRWGGGAPARVHGLGRGPDHPVHRHLWRGRPARRGDVGLRDVRPRARLDPARGACAPSGEDVPADRLAAGAVAAARPGRRHPVRRSAARCARQHHLDPVRQGAATSP